MTARRPERGDLELVQPAASPTAADQTETAALALIANTPGFTDAQKRIEQGHLTDTLAAGQAKPTTLDRYARALGPLRALGRNGAFGDAWDGNTLPIPAPPVLAYLYAREGEITHLTAEGVVTAVNWVHENGRWPDQDQAEALDTTGWENPADNPAVKNHLAARADGENRPDRTQCLALVLPGDQRVITQRCRALTQTGAQAGERCAKPTTNPDGLCHQHLTAEPVHPAEIAVELRRCQNFTVRGGSLCVVHVDHLERCRADLDGWTDSAGKARCPFPAASPMRCADHQHHPAKPGRHWLDGRCRANLAADCPNQAQPTHLCRMHQDADPTHPYSLVGVLVDEPVILPGSTKKARALRLPDVEAGCAYEPEPERLAQLGAVRDALAPHGVEMRQMADLGPDNLHFTDDGTATVQFQVPTRPSGHGIPTRPVGGSRRQFSELEDVDWLRCQYQEQRKSLAQIAKKVGCSKSAVQRALARHGIPTRPGGSRRQFSELEDGAGLERRYITDGATLAEIAGEVGCSPYAVQEALARHGIPTRLGGSRRQFSELEDVDWLRRRYVDESATLAEIAAEVGCSPDTVRNALARHGIPTRPGGKRRQFSELEDVDWLRRRYVDESATLAEIAAEVGCSGKVVGRALARHGIEAPFLTVVLVASGGADCPVAAISAVLDNPNHPDPNRPFTHPYQSASKLPSSYSAWVEARDSSILPVGFWLGRRGGELGQAQLDQLSVQEINGERRVMFKVKPAHSKTGDDRDLVLPPCTCEAEITVREPVPMTPAMRKLAAAEGHDPDTLNLEKRVSKIARRPALCVVCSLTRWLAMRWQQPAPAVRCPDDGCGDAAVNWIDGFLRSLAKGDSLHRIWPPLQAGSWQTPDPFGALDAAGISYIVQRRLKRAELAWSSSHGLKRGAVTGMTQAGMDLAEISEITGNQDLKVLAGYIADDVAEKKRIEAGQRSLGVLWLPDDQDAFAVPDGAITA